MQDLLKTTAHRPWKIPSDSWKYYQEWNKVIFLHWQVDAVVLQKLVPDGLEIDLYNGNPWVSAVGFTMEKIRPRYFPSVSPISNFDELNIRTYVRYEGKAGVYFLKIEAGSNLSCKIAKIVSCLPYQYSKIQRCDKQFHSFNPTDNDTFSIEYSVKDKIINKSTLDKWLTERYALFQEFNQFIIEFEIHHLEWPLSQVCLNNFEINYSKFIPLLSCIPDKMHYSEGVNVLAWSGQRKVNSKK